MGLLFEIEVFEHETPWLQIHKIAIVQPGKLPVACCLSSITPWLVNETLHLNKDIWA